MTDCTSLEVAGWAPCTDAEGPHRRFALWVQGCTLACPGCCNPEMFVPGRGRTVAIAEIVAAIDGAAARWAIEGVTVLGGEPLQQLAAVASLCAAVANRGLGVIVFTGYRLAEARTRPGFERLYPSVDTLVDGRFDAKFSGTGTETPRRFVGSENQRLHHRTARYADDALWRGAPSVELSFVPGAAPQLVGAPALARRVVRHLAPAKRTPSAQPGVTPRNRDGT